MPNLAVHASGETFGAVWPSLSAELGLGLEIVSSAHEISAAARPIPPILVVVGREGDSEALLGSLLVAGFLPPLVVGSEPDHRLAVRVLRAGAADYLVLPPDLSALRSALLEASERVARASDRVKLMETWRSEYDFSQIVGRSPVLRSALERAARIIPHDRATVLITGETGTGKELVARAIHFNGPRAMGAFVEINCAAIPSNLLESELFGYERGAFTDARMAKPGLLEAADGGTLFLDEIGHMAPAVQGKLLKAVEEKRARRLGSVQSREVDLRVIAATHVDLAAAVKRGEFREDLYYRLTTIPIHLPPLRDRGDDILLIAEYFLGRLAEQYGLPLPELDERVRLALLAHRWPGNVRELRNSVERALLLGGHELDPRDLFVDTSLPEPPESAIQFPAPLAEIEKAAAVAMVERFNGNKSAAAAALRISRSRLYRLLDEPEPTESVVPMAGP